MRGKYNTGGGPRERLTIRHLDELMVLKKAMVVFLKDANMQDSMIACELYRKAHNQLKKPIKK